MTRKTIRIAPLEGFECKVNEFREMVGDEGWPEQIPFPYDDSVTSHAPCAGDQLWYGPALFVRNWLMRVITYRLEDSDEEHSCLAVYGRIAGPRRWLRDGSLSVRVTPFSYLEWYEVSEELNKLARDGGLDRADDQRRRDIVMLVRGSSGEDDWSSTDVASVMMSARLES